MTILTKQITIKNTDWTIAAAGDARDGNTSISLSGVTGTISSAYLYWGELNFDGSSDENILLNGSAVSGERLGTSVDTCWGSDHSVGYFADVTSLVTGDGSFAISEMGIGGQGASLVVTYDDGDASNNRDLTFYAGNDATSGNATTTMNLGVVEYSGDDLNIILSVGDGQSYSDGDLAVNGAIIATNQFSGNQGDLWDVQSYEVSSHLTIGENNVVVTNESTSDCLQFVSLIIDKPAEIPTVFLDFNTAIPIDFQIKKIRHWVFWEKETIVIKPGTEPLGQFSPTEEASIVQSVQAIFDRSDIAINVTSTRPTSGEYHSVRFSSDVLSYDDDGDSSTGEVTLLGQAYEGIDRFDLTKTNTVAVLMDTANFSTSYIAATVAH